MDTTEYKWGSKKARERFEPIQMSTDVIEAVMVLAGHMAQRFIDHAEERGDEPDSDETLAYRNNVADVLMLIAHSRSTLVTTMVDSADVPLNLATRTEQKLADGEGAYAGNSVLLGSASKKMLPATYHAAKEAVDRLLMAAMDAEPSATIRMLDPLEAVAAVLGAKKASDSCDCEECRAARAAAESKKNGTLH
jgi:hypothetical protein